jgi:hypothetical protein
VGELVGLTVAAIDTDGTIAGYQWLQTAGSTVTIENTDSADATFIAPTVSENTTFSFQVTVSDNKQSTVNKATDVVILAENSLPTVSINGPTSVLGGSAVELNAIATDSDGSIAQYLWQQTDGTQVVIESPTSATASFTVPHVSVVQQASFKVTVTDDRQGQASHSVELQITPSITAHHS